MALKTIIVHASPDSWAETARLKSKNARVIPANMEDALTSSTNTLAYATQAGWGKIVMRTPMTVATIPVSFGATALMD
jgi:hypothetical protein